MGRKRSPDHDWICMRCECPCNPAGHPEQRHIGGGQNRRACRKPPMPVLRRDLEAMLAEFVSDASAAVRARRAATSTRHLQPGPEGTALRM